MSYCPPGTFIPSQIGFRNTYTLQRQAPCPPCYQVAKALRAYDEDAPIPEGCYCRDLRPPGTNPTAPRLYLPKTTRNITHEDIGTTRTLNWNTDNDNWNTMVARPLKRAHYNNRYGPVLIYHQYILHMWRAIGIDEETRSILVHHGIGPTMSHSLMYRQYDHPAALTCQNTMVDTDDNDAIRQLEIDRRNTELRQSCNYGGN